MLASYATEQRRNMMQAVKQGVGNVMIELQPL